MKAAEALGATYMRPGYYNSAPAGCIADMGEPARIWYNQLGDNANAERRPVCMIEPVAETPETPSTGFSNHQIRFYACENIH